jgi:hypothetical protein
MVDEKSEYARDIDALKASLGFLRITLVSVFVPSGLAVRLGGWQTTQARMLGW